MIRPTLLFGALGLTLGTAHAEAFEPKTMRDTLAAREVERPLILGKGWLEFGLGGEVKNATGYWDSNGEPVDFTDASWLWTTQTLAIRYGVSRRGELYWNFRTHYAQLTNPTMGTDLSNFGIGDPNFGFKLELLRGLNTSLISYIDYKAPAANEAPGNYVGQSNSMGAIVMTTGTPDLTLGVAARQRLGPVALTVEVEHVHRFSNVVQYLVETTNNQYNARMKPGDISRGTADLMLQLGPVAPHVGGELALRQVTRTGQTSGDLFGDLKLKDVEGSDGWSFDLNPGAVINITRGLDLDLAASIPLRGEDLQFFPIEDLQPTRGLTFKAAVELRY